MSAGNLERALEGYEVFNRGEFDRFVNEFNHPEYEFHTGVNVPSVPKVVRGREDLRDWIRQWFQEPWEGQMTLEVERAEELEDGRVLALLTMRAKGRESGIPVEGHYAHIFTFEDGLCRHLEGFPSWAAALKAAGLGEQ
jgi:hypothetical protein